MGFTGPCEYPRVGTSLGIDLSQIFSDISSDSYKINLHTSLILRYIKQLQKAHNIVDTYLIYTGYLEMRLKRYFPTTQLASQQFIIGKRLLFYSKYLLASYTYINYTSSQRENIFKRKVELEIAIDWQLNPIQNQAFLLASQLYIELLSLTSAPCLTSLPLFCFFSIHQSELQIDFRN